jgi:aminopeptidase YwaD
MRTAACKLNPCASAQSTTGESKVLILEMPAHTRRRVVLSAHLDGHDPAESAMDNASGVAVALALARAFSPHVADCRLGLTVCLFSAEEWALAGSKSWLERMHESERRSIALNVNLDTVSGDGYLTALTSEFIGLERFVEETAAAIGVPVSSYRPMMSNSDHYNFVCHGIAALRLVAGFDRPYCDVRRILSPGDTRDRVKLTEMRRAARVAAAIIWQALNADDEDLAGLR